MSLVGEWDESDREYVYILSKRISYLWCEEGKRYKKRYLLVLKMKITRWY